jgi:DNA topoisomerase-3
MGGRQIEPGEADTLIEQREVGPLEGFRSKMGRPFAAKLKLTDANEVQFDFGNPDETEDGEAPDFSDKTPLGPCPKCKSNVYELGNAYACEKSVGPDKTCDFRSGRTILQRPVEPEQMRKLLKDRKTDLLQFVSQRTRRPFSAFLVVQPDGKVGFEFEARDPAKARGPRRSMALRVLGPHPKDKQPVELHAGKYGPYVKHGDVNATLPERDQADALTLDDAVQLLAAKAARDGGTSFARASASAGARTAAPKATKRAAKTATTAKRAPATKPVTRKTTAKRKS